MADSKLKRRLETVGTAGGVTVLDHDPGQIDTVRRFGWKAYYGLANKGWLIEIDASDLTELDMADFEARAREHRDRLAALIRREREALLSRWRQEVRAMPCARHLDTPTLNNHLPQLLDELAAALQARSDQTIPGALSETSPPAHGLQRVKDGFDIEEVVGPYTAIESKGSIPGSRCIESRAGELDTSALA